MQTYSAKFCDSIAQIPQQDWDGFAGQDNPFVQHAFLAALENSGSAIAKTGWQAQHLCLHDAAGGLCGVAPLYLKSHSYGEYVFDHAWAQAYQRAGGRYYPKLLSAVPFTPVTGPRLLAPDPEARSMLLVGMIQRAQDLKLSSVHLNFLAQGDVQCGEQLGLMTRYDLQYHWHNHGYDDFKGFLNALSSRKRKAIRKERQALTQANLRILRLRGDDIKPQHWDAFWAFYQDTSDRKWGQAYLTREFFAQLHETMRAKVLLVLALDGDTPVAGALNLVGRHTIFGRNWGCLERAKFLHFELCYYQAIEHAIEAKLSTVEAGAQGHHKLQRGYLPQLTYSQHWIAHPDFAQAIDAYLDAERPQVIAEQAAMLESSPFRAVPRQIRSICG